MDKNNDDKILKISSSELKEISGGTSLSNLIKKQNIHLAPAYGVNPNPALDFGHTPINPGKNKGKKQNKDNKDALLPKD